MSKAPVTEAELQAFVDEQLAPERVPIVAAWLAEHPDDAARVADYRAQSSALRSALAPVLEEPLPPGLDLRLREPVRRPTPAWRHAAVAASMAGLVLLGGAGGWTLKAWSTPPTAGTAALAREAAASYAVYANDSARPVEVAASQRATLDGWFSERLSRPVSAPDLRAAGLSLLGGRLVSTEHGPAGLYLYRDRAGTRVALYVRPMEVDGTDRMTRREQGSDSGWTWADKGLGFGIFGTAPSDLLHGAANMVRAQSQRT